MCSISFNSTRSLINETGFSFNYCSSYGKDGPLGRRGDIGRMQSFRGPVDVLSAIGSIWVSNWVWLVGTFAPEILLTAVSACMEPKAVLLR